jgi:hypothetical protein
MFLRLGVLGWIGLTFLNAQVGPQSIIRTFAGADWTFQGDGKPAVDAPIGEASDVTLDAAGNL